MDYHIVYVTIYLLSNLYKYSPNCFPVGKHKFIYISTQSHEIGWLYN